MLLAKVSPSSTSGSRITSSGRPSAILRPDTSTTRRCEKCITARHDVLDQDHGRAALVEPDQQCDDVADFGMREVRHRLVGDQELRLRRHGAGELELAHVDLGEVAWKLAAQSMRPTRCRSLLATLVALRLRQMAVRAARVDRVEQRDLQVVGDRHAGERARQLEAAREAEPGAGVRRRPSSLRPSNVTLPVSLSSVPQRQFTSVLLPEPLGPIRLDALAPGDAEVYSVDGRRSRRRSALPRPSTWRRGAAMSQSILPR